jgi:hypothetical protein
MLKEGTVLSVGVPPLAFSVFAMYSEYDPSIISRSYELNYEEDSNQPRRGTVPVPPIKFSVLAKYEPGISLLITS